MLSYLPLKIISQGIYACLVNNVGKATMGTLGLIKSSYSQKNPDVQSVLDELDIKRKVRVVQSMIVNIINSTNDTRLNDLQRTQIFEAISNKSASIEDDPIELSIAYVKQTLKKINMTLDTLNQKVIRYNKKWFRSWRKLDVSDLISNLRRNAKLLDMRYDDLLKIYNFLQKTGIDGK